MMTMMMIIMLMLLLMHADDNDDDDVDDHEEPVQAINSNACALCVPRTEVLLVLGNHQKRGKLDAPCLCRSSLCCAKTEWNDLITGSHIQIQEFLIHWCTISIISSQS